MPGSQTWWRRPLAEFLAIFAGVSLSLLADDWRDHRADARAGVAALHLIAADLVRDSTEIEGGRGVEGTYLADIQEARNRLEYGVADDAARAEVEQVLTQLGVPCFLVAIGLQEQPVVYAR